MLCQNSICISLIGSHFGELMSPERVDVLAPLCRLCEGFLNDAHWMTQQARAETVH